jgi:hypothetical protein
MRKLLVVFAVVLLGFTVGAQAQPDSYFAGGSGFTAGNHLTVDALSYFNTDSGWFRNDGIHQANNPNYITGYCSGCGGFFYHGYWAFDLSTLTSANTAAFTVFSYGIAIDPGTLLLYGTSLNPSDVDSSLDYTSVTLYNDLVAGPLIGSISLTPGNSLQDITVTLNAAGISWLDAHAGSGAVIGADWSQAYTPEPGSLLLLSTGIVGLAGAIRRKLF